MLLLIPVLALLPNAPSGSYTKVSITIVTKVDLRLSRDTLAFLPS